MRASARRRAPRAPPVVGEAVPDAGDGHGEEAAPSVDSFAEPRDRELPDDLLELLAVDVRDEEPGRVRPEVDRCDARHRVGRNTRSQRVRRCAPSSERAAPATARGRRGDARSRPGDPGSRGRHRRGAARFAPTLLEQRELARDRAARTASPAATGRRRGPTRRRCRRATARDRRGTRQGSPAQSRGPRRAIVPAAASGSRWTQFGSKRRNFGHYMPSECAYLGSNLGIHWTQSSWEVGDGRRRDERSLVGGRAPYVQDDVERIRGRFHIEHTLARLGAERLWQLLHSEPTTSLRSAR